MEIPDYFKWMRMCDENVEMVGVLRRRSTEQQTRQICILPILKHCIGNEPDICRLQQTSQISPVSQRTSFVCSECKNMTSLCQIVAEMDLLVRKVYRYLRVLPDVIGQENTITILHGGYQQAQEAVRRFGDVTKKGRLAVTRNSKTGVEWRFSS